MDFHKDCEACQTARRMALDEADTATVHDLVAAGVTNGLLHKVALRLKQAQTLADTLAQAEKVGA